MPQWPPKYATVHSAHIFFALWTIDYSFCILFSRAISTYICNQYEKGDDSTRLYPVDPRKRGLVDQMLYVSEHIDDVVKTYVVSGRSAYRHLRYRTEKIINN